MEDFNGSVAQTQVEVSTEIVVSSVVGDNFYKAAIITKAVDKLYILSKNSYADILDSAIADADAKARIANLCESLFDYGASVILYLMPPTYYRTYKMRAYWCYLDLVYENDETDGVKLSSASEDLIEKLGKPDGEFSRFCIDVPVNSETAATDTDLEAGIKQLLGDLNALEIKPWVMARGGVWENGAEKADVFVLASGKFAYSPLMYQLGRTLNYLNATGTSVGNSIDMVACSRVNVLATLDTRVDEIDNDSFALQTALTNSNVHYFKTIGNGTGQIVNFGKKTLNGDFIVADWMVAYCNYMVRVACAEILTVMNTFRNTGTYMKILNKMDEIVGRFVDLGRIEQYKNTAPAFANLPSAGGDVIKIPSAWEGKFVDNNRKVAISGTLYVED